MTSTVETSSPLQTALQDGLKTALTGFLTEPTSEEARNAIYATLASMVEVEARRVIASHLHVENRDGKAYVSLDAPLAHLLQGLFGDSDIFGDLRWNYQVAVPGWRPPTAEEIIEHTRPYIDPRTRRPTRGKPMT